MVTGVVRVQAFSSYECGKSSLSACRPDHPCTGARAVQPPDDAVTSPAGALMTSPDHVTAAPDDDASCSPSSVTIVDLDAAATDDDDERGGGVVGKPAAARGPPTLRVPTPSSWEKYRVAAVGVPSPRADEPSPGVGDAKVMVVAERPCHDLLPDDVDRRSTCSCGAVSTDAQVDLLLTLSARGSHAHCIYSPATPV